MNIPTTHTTTIRNVMSAILALACLVGLVWSMPYILGQPAKAQQSSPPPQPGQAFSISPPLIELQGNPGETVTTKIKFTNISDSELLIKTQFNDFGAKNETGEPNIIFEDQDNTAFSLRRWIASPTPFKIAKKATKTVEFPIAIPKSAEPGGHYAVIRFTGTTPELEDSGVALTASIGSLVLMRVSGEVKEKAAVADFFAATPRYEKSSFFEQSPITLIERVRNEGNIHLKPTGTVKVNDMFGKEVANLRVNGTPGNTKDSPRSVLPKSIRRFEQNLANKWMFGRYEAKLDLAYGQNNQQKLSATTSFWVIPYKLILFVLAVLIALFFLLRFSLKKYNKYIINKAKAREENTQVKNNDQQQ